MTSRLANVTMQNTEKVNVTLKTPSILIWWFTPKPPNLIPHLIPHLIFRLYSGTSDSGPSEIRTLYDKPLYKGHCSRSQKLRAL